MQILADEECRVNTVGGSTLAYFAKASKRGTNRKNQDKNQDKKKCTYCKRKGYEASECNKKKDKEEKVNTSKVTRAGSRSSATKANVAIAKDNLITLIDPSEDTCITSAFLAATKDDLIQLLNSPLSDDDISTAYIYFPLTDVNNDIPLDISYAHMAHARIEDVDLSDKWLIDSSASQIMCSNRYWFHQFNPLPNHIMITLGDNSTIPATGHGRILVWMNTGSHYKRIMLQDILYILDMCYARTLRIVNNRLDYLLGVIESTFNDIKVAQLR